MRGRGIGEHDAPTDRIRDALLDGITPIVRDLGARRMDRILAIRELGRLGYALGSGALIDLLRDGGEPLRDEAVRALEAISGYAWGDDAGRWSAWYEGLPGRAVAAARPLQGV